MFKSGKKILSQMRDSQIIVDLQKFCVNKITFRKSLEEKEANLPVFHRLGRPIPAVRVT
jgi:hypothetical protein